MNEIIVKPPFVQDFFGKKITQEAWIDTAADETVMVGTYPGREYDYELLYKGDPHICFLYGYENHHHTNEQLDWVRERWDWFHEHYFRGFFVWNDWYKTFQKPTDSGYGTKQYAIREPTVIHDFVAECHEHGFQVGCYLRRPSLKVRDDGVVFWGEQDLRTTFYELALLCWEYKFTGIYGDSFHCGELKDTLWFLDTLRRFLTHIGKQIGFESFLFGHESFSSWNRMHQGLNAVMVHQRLDYVLRGESMQWPPESGDDPLWHKHYNDIGWGNALWDVKHQWLDTKAWPGSIMSQALLLETIGKDKGCARLQKSMLEAWEGSYYPAYLQKRKEYNDER